MKKLNIKSCPSFVQLRAISLASATLLLAFVTAACGENFVAKTLPPGPEPDEPRTTEELSKELKAILQSSAVHCADQSEATCPGSVGMVLMKTQLDGLTSGTACTGFLVDPTTLITSSRCIPLSSTEGAFCRDDIGFLFPSTIRYPAETAICDHVISVSRDGGHAVVRLKTPLNRSYSRLSRDGIADQIQAKIISIDQEPSLKSESEQKSEQKLVGVIKAKTCTAIQKTILQPGFQHRFHSRATFANCETAPSHLGSPVFNEHGDVISIVQGSAVQDSTLANGEPDSHPLVRKLMGSEPKTFEPFSIVANVACLELPELSSKEQPETHPDKLRLGPPRSECTTGNEVVKLLQHLYDTYDLNGLNKVFGNFKSSVPQAIEFFLQKIVLPQSSTGTLPGEFRVVPEVSCVKDPLTWLNEIGVTPDALTTESHATLAYTAPVWGLVAELDHLYRIQFEPLTIAQIQVQLGFDYQELMKNGTAQATVVTKRLHPPGPTKTRQIALRLCR